MLFFCDIVAITSLLCYHKLEKSGNTVIFVKKELFTYYSTQSRREMNAVVMTPDDGAVHPVLYLLHGYSGDEHSLSDDNEICSIIEEYMSDCTVVFPYIYISRQREKCTALDFINSSAYDNFIFELTVSLMPNIETKYAIDENKRAISGFSMGGRESLYIGFMRPDLFRVVGGACPAPGLTPGENKSLHPGQLKDEFFRPCTSCENYPKILISAGDNDTVVGDIPYRYSELLKNNSVPHDFHVVMGGEHTNSSVAEHLRELSLLIHEI